MSEQTVFEKLGVEYEERDGILYPLITTGVEDEKANVGKYGVIQHSRCSRSFLYQSN